jgi:hypothetical protein
VSQPIHRISGCLRGTSTNWLGDYVAPAFNIEFRFFDNGSSLSPKRKGPAERTLANDGRKKLIRINTWLIDLMNFKKMVSAIA